MLKVMRDQFRNLKWILWFVVFVFVLLIFVDWGMGRAGGRGAMEGVAAKVGKFTISENVFVKEMRSTEQRFRSMYGEQYDQIRDQLDIPTMTLQNLIDRHLLLRQADTLGLRVTDKELLEEITAIPAFQREDGSFVGEELYSRILRSNQMTPEEFEAALRRDLLVRKLQQALAAGIVISDAEVEQEYRRRNDTVSADVVFVGLDRGLERAVVSDEEARAFYDAHQDRFTHPDQWKLHYLLVDGFRLRRTMTVPDDQIAEYYASHSSEFAREEQVRARHILIKPNTDDDAGWREAQYRIREVAVRAQLPNADFAALAREFSDDSGSKDAGGDLGWFGKGRMVKEFEDVVFSLQDGQVSGPVKSQFGYHVIKLEGRQASGVRPLEEVKAQVREKLAEGLADAEGSRRATALKEKIDGGKLSTEEQWRALADDAVTSNVTPWFTKGEPIPGLGRDPEMLEEVTAAAEGYIGGPRRSGRGWVVYRVAQMRKAGTTPFDEAKEEAREAAKRNKALAIVKAELDAKRGTLMSADLATAAPTLGGTLQHVTDHRRGAAIQGVGVSEQLEDLLFTAPVSALTPVVEVGERGVAFARVSSRKVTDAAALAEGKAALHDSMVQDQLEKLLASVLAEVKRENPVTINSQVVDRYKRQST